MMTVVFEIIMTLLISSMSFIVLFILARFVQLRRRFQFVPNDSMINQALPTVSVCIPARNEVHAMTECLERLLASDYERLEIIVLDDSSVDDTSMLIKSFAHAGVRFVEGSPLPSGWLGKNHALQGLAEEASGQYVLFLDVDTILKPFSIRAMVQYTESKHLPLISVIPKRDDGLRASVIFGTLRYFWTMLLGSKSYPAVSGAAWLVDRAKLMANGGMAPYKNVARPEVYVAAALSAQEIPLFVSSQRLGVSYEKKWQSQIETSIRLLTPEFRSSMNVTLLGLLLASMVLVPAISFLYGLLNGYAYLLIVCGIYDIAMTILSLVYLKSTWRRGWWLGAVLWPYAVMQESVLMTLSGYKYARKSVTWKGRPIQTSVSTSSRLAD